MVKGGAVHACSPVACCRTWMQGVPVSECAHAYPQLLSLPTPGLGMAYHHNCAEYRLFPGGDPADYPASNWGKVIHAGDSQVNHAQKEHTSPIEKRGPPGRRWHAWSTPTYLTHTLLLCGLLLCRVLAPGGAPRVTGWATSPGACCSSLAGATTCAGHLSELMELEMMAAILSIVELRELNQGLLGHFQSQGTGHPVVDITGVHW